MKKFQAHDKWGEEERPKTQQRKKSTTEDTRKISKHDSSGCRMDYFEDENKSMEYSKIHSYQIERRSRTTSQAFVKMSKHEAIQMYDSKEISWDINLANERDGINEANIGAQQSDHKENYEKIHEGVHPLCPNKGNGYPHSKYRAFKVMSEPTDTRMKFKKEFSPVNDTKIECFSIRIDSNEIGVNEENALSALQKSNIPFLKSNRSFQYCNEQNTDQSNPIFHDVSEKVYMHGERATSQSDNNMHDSSQRATFLNNSASYGTVGFNMFKLTDLLHYKINLMQEKQLFEYASAVKSRILEKIDKFQNPEKEELEFLCEITDRDQSEKNQRIITTRTCHIVRNAIDKLPCLLNTIEISPPSQILVYQTVPNLHGIRSSHCSNYESPVFEIVQDSKMLLTSATDYNLTDDVAQNDKYVISKEISASNDFRGNCEVQNCKTNNAKNNSSSLITEDENITEESSKFCRPPSDKSGISLVQKFSFEEKNSVFIAFNLDSLLKYDVHTMHGNLVFDYGFSLKKRILENIDQFKDPHKEKLQIMCELTDGTQKVENQKLINEQMLDLIDNYIDGISDEEWKSFSQKISRNVHPSRSHFKNEIIHRQNPGEQSRNALTRKSHMEEKVHEHRQNFSDGQTRNAHLKRSHYKDEMAHEYRKSDEQPKNVQSRRYHFKDEMVQNYSDRQLRNAHRNRAHYEDEVRHERRQNFSDGQSRNVHQRRSHEDARKI